MSLSLRSSYAPRVKVFPGFDNIVMITDGGSKSVGRDGWTGLLGVRSCDDERYDGPSVTDRVSEMMCPSFSLPCR